jgi:hypothetical protein
MQQGDGEDDRQYPRHRRSYPGAAAGCKGSVRLPVAASGYLTKARDWFRTKDRQCVRSRPFALRGHRAALDSSSEPVLQTIEKHLSNMNLARSAVMY